MLIGKVMRWLLTRGIGRYSAYPHLAAQAVEEALEDWLDSDFALDDVQRFAA